MVVIGILIINQRPADWSKFRIQVGHHFYNIIDINNVMSVRYSSILERVRLGLIKKIVFNTNKPIVMHR